MLWDLAKYNDNVAFRYGDAIITYKKLLDDCNELSDAIGKRTLAFILTSNTYESALAYISFINSEIVPLLLDADLDKQLFINLLNIYEPEYIWMPAADAERAACFQGAELYSYGNYKLYHTQYKAGEEDLLPELALLISTSGSTGSPKLIRQSYDNLKANTRSIIEYLKISDSEVAITTLPMNYVYGLSVINTHIFAGAQVILTELIPYSKKFWTLFDECKATSFAGVPYTYEMLDKLRYTKKDGRHPTLKTMTQAGGKLLPDLHEKFAQYAAKNGIDFVVMYGASEATARMGYLPADRAIEKKGSMGIPIPGGRFEIIGDDEKLIDSADVTGELVYHGANVTLGYAEERSDLKKPDENKGVLHTGDMAYRDKDGFYYISGRKKRFVKILGNRIGLDETERLLKSRFNSIDIACTGKDDLLVVCVACDLPEEEMIDYISETMHINSKMIVIKRIDAIPQNASGKILYSELTF